jgi:serine/threonine protein kinase
MSMENLADGSKPTSDPPSDENAKVPDLSGRTLGDFLLVRKLGQGGMGQVYLARQVSLKRQVAVKILRPELAENQTSLQRFRREAEAVAGINHANIVQIYQIGESGGMHYMALEYVEGRNLRDYLAKKGPPDLLVALTIMRQVASALQRAGEMGFVHRDVKPENILLTRKNEVKVADFGLSRCFATDEPLHLTQSGITMGTPLYMSPEQVQGRTVDPRSDIYSFGVSCYHMLAGEPPFRGATAFEVAIQHVQNDPPPLAERRPDLPPELCALVHRMMAKRPEDRPQSAREILRELMRIREGVAQGYTAPLSPFPSLSAAGRSGDLNPIASPSGTVAVSTPPGRGRRWWFGVGALLLAFSVGVAARWAADPLPPDSKAAMPSETPENLHRARWEAEELTLLARVDNKDLTREASVDAVIELLMLYTRERKWTEAEEFLASLAKKTKFLEKGDLGLKGRPRPMGNFYATHLATLGRAIVLAYRDEPVASNKLFGSAFSFQGVPKKVETHPALDAFFTAHPRWRREVADALDRNAKNLNPVTRKLEDPLFERYRSYVPKLPIPPEKRPEPK